eukprot:snap_masked-scaffold_42-processed-gene-0.14-mRNA-1 protein AED:1.00 eAED:1.00 QI:0/-1/0/0/-1/1/1/0/152
MDEKQYKFRCLYFNAETSLTKKFLLTFYEVTDAYSGIKKPAELSLFDVQCKRSFLKRIVPPSCFKLHDFYLGATFVLYNRQFQVDGFADEVTKQYFESRKLHVRTRFSLPWNDTTAKKLTLLQEQSRITYSVLVEQLLYIEITGMLSSNLTE